MLATDPIQKSNDKKPTINGLGKITVEPPKSRRTETEMAPTEPYANRLEAFESQLKVN